MANEVEILSLTWVEDGPKKILLVAKKIKVSANSAKLNLKVNENVQYPRYAPLSEISKYMVPESPKETIAPKAKDEETSDEEAVNEIKSNLGISNETPITPKPTKKEKPIFATVEEKKEWEAAQNKGE